MSPERVLLIRSGRHLHVALTALRERFPECEIAVVGTAGTEPVLAQAGIAPEHMLIYSATPRFTPLAFNMSRTAIAARRWRYTRVAILWNDPDGRGQGNVDRTAFGLAPAGFIAVTPDGRLVERTLFPQLGHELRRTLMSLAAGAVIGALYGPAFFVAGVRKLLAARSGSLRANVAEVRPKPDTTYDAETGRLKPAPAYHVGDAKDQAA